MNKRHRILLIVLSFLFCFQIYAGQEKQEIQIAVAANLSYAIKGIVAEFNAENPDVEVKVIIGSSGKLTAQIINGAPFDVFLSADKYYPDMLFKKKIAKEKYKVYAKGILILFSKNSQKFNKEMKVLEEANVETIAISNIKLAPYGAAAWQALRNSNILGQVTNKLVYAQNVAQTVQYSMTVADLGFIAKSALFAPQMEKYREENKYWLAVDSALYKPIEQAAVLLKKNENSLKFYDFIFSKKGKKIFKDSGYDI